MDIFRRTDRIKSFECGADNVQRPDSLLSWIMDAAEDHATLLGFGREFCEQKCLAWVEYRLSVQVDRLPKWKEAVEVSTWTAPTSPLIATRDFLMEGAGGESLVRASCQWVLIHAERRRPVPLRREVPQLMGESMTPLFPDPVDLVPPDGLVQARLFCSEWHNVDFNGHTNNAVYLIWALDALPAGWMSERLLRGIEISFQKETFPGTEVEVLWKREDPFTWHAVVAGGDVRAVLRLEWEDVRNEAEAAGAGMRGLSAV